MTGSSVTHRFFVVNGGLRCANPPYVLLRAASQKPSLRGAKRRSNPFFLYVVRWIASRSPSSGAHSRDPLARNDGASICSGSQGGIA